MIRMEKRGIGHMELLDRAREARGKNTKEWYRVAVQLYNRAYGVALSCNDKALADEILAERDAYCKESD